MRLFIAIDLPDVVKAEIQNLIRRHQTPLEKMAVHMRWVRQDQFHP